MQSHFAHPWGLLWFIALPFLLVAFVSLERFRQRELQSVFRWQPMRQGRSRPLYWTQAALFVSVYLLLVVSWMGPLGRAQAGPEPTATSEVGALLTKKPQGAALRQLVLFIDASASMAVLDGFEGRSRLENAKEVAGLLVEGLAGEEVSLYAFTGEPTQLAPATRDYLFVLMQLDQLSIDEGEVGGTHYGRAIEELVRLQKSPTAPAAPRTVLFFSDGGDQQTENQEKNKQLLNQLEQLVKRGWQFIVVGMGSLEGGFIPQFTYRGERVHVSLEEALLREMGSLPGGSYVSAKGIAPLELVALLKQKIAAAPVEGQEGSSEDREREEPASLHYQQLFQLPLAAALFLWGFYLLIPDRPLRLRESHKASGIETLEVESALARW